jgi:peptidyl-tRNA hydrolase, PTH1 family
MKLVIGLGNPGRKYLKTRHNVGFEVASLLASKLSASSPKKQFAGQYCEGMLGSQKVGLLCPDTYMNRSGDSARAAVDFFKLPLDSLLVVCDDLNLPLGRLRIRPNGSAGGQKGLADIIRQLATEDFPRLRVGIGAPPAGWDAADFVLGRFEESEKTEVEICLRRAMDAALNWISEGIASCMNQYNRV